MRQLYLKCVLSTYEFYYILHKLMVVYNWPLMFAGQSGQAELLYMYCWSKQASNNFSNLTSFVSFDYKVQNLVFIFTIVETLFFFSLFYLFGFAETSFTFKLFESVFKLASTLIGSCYNRKQNCIETVLHLSRIKDQSQIKQSRNLLNFSVVTLRFQLLYKLQV